MPASKKASKKKAAKKKSVPRKPAPKKKASKKKAAKKKPAKKAAPRTPPKKKAVLSEVALLEPKVLASIKRLCKKAKPDRAGHKLCSMVEIRDDLGIQASDKAADQQVRRVLVRLQQAKIIRAKGNTRAKRYRLL